VIGRREHAIGVIYLFLTAACWGFVAPTVKQLTGSVDPYTISFFRVFLASLVFLALYVARRSDWRRLRWLLPWVLLGAVGRAGNYLLYNRGLVDMPSNAATILAPVQTVSVALLARWLLGERIGHKWLGMALSIGGVALIWWNGQGWQTLGESRYALGNALLVLSGVATALQFCSQKALSGTLSGLEILIPVFGWSTLITLPAAVWAGDMGRAGYGVATWGLLLFLGFVLTGASFLFLARGYQRCSATTAVVITNTTVFFTLIWSRALLDEAVSAAMVAGAVLGLVGAVAVIQADRRAIVELRTAG